MTGTLLSVPVFRAVDATGLPLNGGKLQFFVTGTTTPASVYTSSSLGTPLSNPVVADSGGLFVPIYLDPAVTYRVQLLNSAGSLIRDVDPLNAPFVNGAGSVTASMLASGAAASNLGFTPVNKAGDTATNLRLAYSALTVDTAGQLCAQVNEQDASYTFVLTDAGKMVRANAAGGIAYTIPPNASVAFPIGVPIVVRNVGAGVITLTRGAGVTQLLAGGSTSKDVALAQWGLATLLQETLNSWICAGTGVS